MSGYKLWKLNQIKSQNTSLIWRIQNYQIKSCGLVCMEGVQIAKTYTNSAHFNLRNGSLGFKATSQQTSKDTDFNQVGRGLIHRSVVSKVAVLSIQELLQWKNKAHVLIYVCKSDPNTFLQLVISRTTHCLIHSSLKSSSFSFYLNE